VTATTGPEIAEAWLEGNEAELSTIRRALHATPELGRQEYATTALISSWERLVKLGMRPRPFRMTFAIPGLSSRDGRSATMARSR